MFKIIKYLVYLAIILVVLFLYWFLPKYSFIHKNPGYCTQLSGNLYYCGNDARLDSLFNLSGKK